MRLYDDQLIVGGEDHRSGEDDDGEGRFVALAEWARERFPIGEIRHRWSGQVMEPVDGSALIGTDITDPPQMFFATGDSGHGITHGTIAGMLLTDQILGRPNEWRRIYDPARLPVTSTEFVQDNLDTIWHYLEWLTSGDVGAAESIDRGEGAVVRRGLSKRALYRDEEGRLYDYSAVCPHLGVLWPGIPRKSAGTVLVTVPGSMRTAVR